MIDNYVKLRPGHWFQMFRTGPGPSYDNNYMAYYGRIPSDAMSILRYNLVEKVLGSFDSVCDFGYGNGAFLHYCISKNKITYGTDISNYPLPEKSRFVTLENLEDLEIDVITFFDSIEHIHNSDLTSFLNRFPKSKNVVISLPHFHEHLGAEWFKSWKHRKPNEHFHHFDTHGLVGLLEESNFEILYIGNDEDQIRKPVDEYTNILTVIARRK